MYKLLCTERECARRCNFYLCAEATISRPINGYNACHVQNSPPPATADDILWFSQQQQQQQIIIIILLFYDVVNRTVCCQHRPSEIASQKSCEMRNLMGNKAVGNVLKYSIPQT